MSFNDEDSDGDRTIGTPLLDSDIAKLTDWICKESTKTVWRVDETVSLSPSKRWTPSAVSSDGKKILYVRPQGDLPHFIKDRLRLAGQQGFHLVIAVDVGTLYQPGLLMEMGQLNCSVLVLDDPVTANQLTERQMLAALADIGVPVDPTVRKEIVQLSLSNLSVGTSFERGRRLEAVIAFLFSQVSDLSVFQRNYRSATEEIDIVLRVDNLSGHVWQKSGTPFILVEAKNRQGAADQAMMSELIVKLQTKRGSAKFGFFVSISGFTDPARLQELRYSSGDDICVVTFDLANIKDFAEAVSLDDWLDRHVSEALLR